MKINTEEELWMIKLACTPFFETHQFQRHCFVRYTAVVYDKGIIAPSTVMASPEMQKLMESSIKDFALRGHDTIKRQFFDHCSSTGEVDAMHRFDEFLDKYVTTRDSRLEVALSEALGIDSQRGKYYSSDQFVPLLKFLRSHGIELADTYFIINTWNHMEEDPEDCVTVVSAMRLLTQHMASGA